MTAMAIQRPCDTVSLFQGFRPRTVGPGKPAAQRYR